ncbi:hypothetical protein L2E82_40817 [Cichorium intybus]|uniref:Uncharacterized protein n=1 Tax=Cichorium intybus TaxID=13427 RepID=A0ACB9AN02_CICIN|nr:hypothetical protein L2E82_40817 [Cichorium intybus]
MPSSGVLDGSGTHSPTMGLRYTQSGDGSGGEIEDNNNIVAAAEAVLAGEENSTGGAADTAAVEIGEGGGVGTVYKGIGQQRCHHSCRLTVDGAAVVAAGDDDALGGLLRTEKCNLTTPPPDFGVFVRL